MLKSIKHRVLFKFSMYNCRKGLYKEFPQPRDGRSLLSRLKKTERLKNVKQRGNQTGVDNLTAFLIFFRLGLSNRVREAFQGNTLHRCLCSKEMKMSVLMKKQFTF